MTRPASKLSTAVLVAFALLLAPGAPRSGAAVRNYDLGDTTLPDSSSMGPLPVRLWGVIGVPDSPGHHPIVLVAHGRHGDNCPHTQSFVFSWPCYPREQRNDFGMRHIVRALAARGIAAIAPDLNASYAIGWGADDNERRWPRIVNLTLRELAAADNGGLDDPGLALAPDFGLPVGGKIDFGRLGILGHSRSGHNTVRLARARARHDNAPDTRHGLGPVDSLFLLAPVYAGVRLPDIETAVVIGGCDGDVHSQGRRYFEGAEARAGRRQDAFLIKLERANHNYFNRTLSDLGTDDGPFGAGRHCSDHEPLKPAAQQRWIDRVASGYFATTLRGAAPPAWMRPVREPFTSLSGQIASVRQLFP